MLGKSFPRERRKLLDGKLHRQKPGTKSGNERKAVCKNKNKSFACSLGERAAEEEEKDFYNFLQQSEKFGELLKEKKSFSISGSLPSPSREMSR